MSFTTQACVLRSQDVGERDWLLTLFTRERGKLDVIAKGVRAPESKLRSHVGPLQLLEVHIIAQRRFTLAGSIIISSYPRLRISLVNYIVAEHVCETVRLLFPYEHADARTFERLQTALDVCGEVHFLPAQAVAFSVACDLKFLMLSGIVLRFDTCTTCGSKKVSLLSRDGARCANCSSQAIQLGSAALIRLHLLLVGPLVETAHRVISDAEAKSLLLAAHFICSSHDMPTHATASSLKELLAQKT